MAKETDKIVNAIISKMTGKRRVSYRISWDEMLQMIDEHFIIPALTEDEYKNIYRAFVGNLIFIAVKKRVSKDGQYEMTVCQGRGRIIFMKEIDSNTIYKSKIGFFAWKKLKKEIKNKFEERKQKNVG